MNQIIKTETVDFNALVKSVSLSENIQSKMITILNEEFTEEQHRWYIANLYIFMNYHPTTDFPINLETLVRLVDFANKQNAKRTLKNNFIEGEDYKILLIPKDEQVKTNGGAGINKEKIMMNIDTFKNMCMLVKTEKSKEIRKYYVKLENIYNKIIKEEIENTKNLLEEKDKLLIQTQKQLDQKTKLKVKKWYDQSPYHVIYAVKSNKDDPNSLIIIGKSKNIKDRESNYFTHNQESDMFFIRKCYNCDLTEKVIHHILDKYREERNKEWFDISEELATYTINLVCDFLDKFINCSEKLPEFKIKEFIDDLNIKHFDTQIKFKEPIVNVPTIIYNNELTNYNKFISECCEINDEYYCLSYDIIAAYRLWCKGDLTREIKKKFLDYIKSIYNTKDRFMEEYGTRSIHIIGIRPKILEFKPDNECKLKKYEEFFIDKCHTGYTFRIGYNVFIENYTNWLQDKYPNYKISKTHHNEIKEYFNRKFLIGLIPGTLLGIWGIQLKIDKLPTYGIRDKTKCKTIYKIDIKTKDILEIYQGLPEASTKLNLTPKTISDNIKFGKTFYDNANKDIRILLKYDENGNENDNENDNENENENNQDIKVVFNKRITLKKIYRINYETKEILETYDGVIGVANKLNISTTTISKYIKIQKTININNIKCILSFTEEIDIKENENENDNSIKIIKRKSYKKIYKINSITNELLETFNGILDAATKLNIGECTVSRYIKSGNILKHNNNEISCVLKHNY